MSLVAYNGGIDMFQQMTTSDVLREIEKGQGIAAEFSRQILEAIYIDPQTLKEPFTI